MKHTLAWVDAAGAVRFDYRPVQLDTQGAGVEPIPPQVRAY
jgi:succinate dehydrogenase / fumarate reductase flavoprotein subunit